MRIKIATSDKITAEQRESFLAYARARVADYVADDDPKPMAEWPQLLEQLAELVLVARSDQGMPQGIADAITALSPEAIATACGMTGLMAQLCGMNGRQMFATHEAEGDPVTGAAIAGFMLGRVATNAEAAILARLVGTLEPVERRSAVSMCAAFLTVLEFVPGAVRMLHYPGKEV